MVTHPARTIPFNELMAGLQAANDNGFVKVQTAANGLRQFTYTQECNYGKHWDQYTELARGLIADNDKVVATPFPKFWNYGERDIPIPDLPFETYEKVDGSLIIVFHHNGHWCTATKGSFNSQQSSDALVLLQDKYRNESLVPGHTYLFEYVGPSNHIVVHYPEHELVLLSIYNAHGWEYDYRGVHVYAEHIGCRAAERHAYNSISELLAIAGTLPATSEGFVLRFSNGYRLKIKGDEYCRLHRLISNVTPLAIWEAMQAGDDLDAMRKELPEEFHRDFDAIRGLLQGGVDEIVYYTKKRVEAYKNLSDRELGMFLREGNVAIEGPDVEQLVFPMRKQGEQKVRALALKRIRPTGNVLPGYVPSGAMNRMQES